MKIRVVIAQRFVFWAFQVITNNVVQVDNFCDRHPPSGQRQQILNDIGGTFTGILDGTDGFLQRAIFRQVHEDQLRIADQPRQDVVQVMGHAPGQHADGFHFLSPLKLVQQSFFFRRSGHPFRNISDHAQRQVVRYRYHPAFIVNGDLLDWKVVLEHPDPPGLECPGELLAENPGNMARHNMLDFSSDALIGGCRQVFRFSPYVDEPAVAIELEHDIGDGLEDGPGPGLTLAAFILRPFAFDHLFLQRLFAFADLVGHLAEPSGDVGQLIMVHLVEPIVMVSPGHLVHPLA